jgi:DNA-binding MarR family transcriptional regulator
MEKQETRKMMNHFLKKLFFKVLEIQEKNVSIATKNRLSRTEIHALEVIEETDNPILTTVANELNISKATASVSIERLVKKGFLKKHKDPIDKRKSYLALTESGKICYDQHAYYHEKMVDALVHDFKIEEYPELLKGLKNLSSFLDNYNDNE